MTQEVQPLTWQKRTNIEEHMQFFSKINEIIANLAPTVDEAEAAIAQATQAVATANAASAAASAAASQAQTAASTVAGYDARLTAAEDDIDTQGQQITVLQGRAGALETGMTALGTRMTAAETKNSQQDTAIAALQTADGQNVKINRINDYAVGLTGNQNFTGIKIAGTANGLGMDTQSGYNIFNIKAKGSAVGIDMKDTSDDVNGTAADRRLLSIRHFYSGGSYDTYWLEFLPRNAIVDKDTTSSSGGIEFVVANNNEVTVNLFAYNSDGAVVRKQLSKFMNGAWN